jgi:hypothetical protein
MLRRPHRWCRIGVTVGTEEIALEAGRLVAVHSVADGAGERTVVFCHPAPGAGGFDPDPGRRRHASRSRRNATAIATTSTPACTGGLQGRGLLLQGLRVPVDTSNSQTGSTAVESAR